MSYSPLDFALLYARMGRFVVPLWPLNEAGDTCTCPKSSGCPSPGKHPIPDRGEHASTLHEATIRSWWAENPSAGVAVVLDPSGLVALDVDVSHDKPGRASLATIADELPLTQTATTGSGGEHRVFTRTDDSQRARRIGFLPGLDLLGRGYIVVAPTRHISGGTYAWTDLRAPAPLPPVLAQHFRPRPGKLDGPALASLEPATPDVIERARARLARHGPAIEREGGDQHTFAAGAILLRGYGLTGDEAWPLALEWNATCQPPWEEGDLAEKLRNGARYGQGVVGEERANGTAAAEFAAMLAEMHAPPPGSFHEDLAIALADVQSFLGSPVLATVEPLFHAATALIGRSYPPTVWLVNGLVMGAGTGVIGGEPKTYKTWAATEIAMAVATGTRAFGHFSTTAGPTAYFYAEDDAQPLFNRLRSLAAGRGMTVEAALARMHVQPRGRALDLTRDEDVALVIASARRLGPLKLLVLDPLRDVHSGEEDSSDAMAIVMKRLRAISSILKCKVLFVHHTSKGNETTTKRRPGQRLRGSGAIHGAVDSGLYLSDTQGNGVDELVNTVNSEIKGAQGAGVFTMTLNIEDGPDGTAVKATWNVERMTSESVRVKSATADDERMLETLKVSGPVVWKTLRDTCGMGKEKAAAAKARLMLAKRIVEVSERYFDEYSRPRERSFIRLAEDATPGVPDTDETKV